LVHLSLSTFFPLFLEFFLFLKHSVDSRLAYTSSTVLSLNILLGILFCQKFFQGMKEHIWLSIFKDGIINMLKTEEIILDVVAGVLCF